MIFDYTNNTYWEKGPFGFYPIWTGSAWEFDNWFGGTGNTIQTKGTWAAGFRPLYWEIEIDPDFLTGGPLTAQLQDASNAVIAQMPAAIVAPGIYSTPIVGQTTDIRYLVLQSTNNVSVYPHPLVSAIRFNDSDPLFWRDRVGTNELLVGHELLKLKEISYTPGTPGIPSSPGQPYRPAYTSYETLVVCKYRPVNGLISGHWVQVGTIPGQPPVPGEALGRTQEWVFVPGPGDPRFAGITYYQDAVYSCQMETVATYHEGQDYVAPVVGVPATESQMSIELNMGWNSGARSIASFDTDGYMQIIVPYPLTGAVVGLANDHQESGYSQITHGFYFSGGVAYIIESGTIVRRIDVYENEDDFRIERIHDVVSYYWFGDLVYVSEVPSDDEVFLEAVLYAGDDYLFAPEISPLVGILSEMMPMSARPPGYTEMLPMIATDRTRFGKMQPMKTLAYSGQAGIPHFEPMTSVSSNKPYGEARTSMLPMRGYSGGGLLVPSYAICNAAMSFMTSAATGLTGGIGGADVEMLPLWSRASDHAYGESATSFEPMVSGSAALPSDTALYFEQALLVESMVPRLTLMVALSTDMLVATAITGTREAVATILEKLESHDTLSASGEFMARLDTVVYVSFQDQISGSDDATTWVVNTDTQASTRYENFNFNSFAKWRGAYYGAKSDGLYLLEGDDDDGVPIDAMVSFGVQRFGDTLYKRVPTVYIGARSDGRLILRVKDGDKEYLYQTRTSSPRLATQRFDIGRGIRANALEFELYNQAGDDFELASIEFIPLLTQRKQ